MDIEAVAKQIVDSAIKVHKHLGPGLLESTYQVCLAYELQKRGLRVECELELPVEYDGVKLDAGYRLDMVIERSVIVENKTVDHILAVHEAQLLTYLKLGGYHIGFLINWNVSLLKYGLKRYVY